MKCKKIRGITLITASMVIALAGLSGCGQKESKQEQVNAKIQQDNSSTKEHTIATKAGEKGCVDAESLAKELNKKYAGQELVVMIERAGATYPKWDIDYIRKLMPDIKITSKIFGNDTAEKTIKTAFTADEQLDLVEFWPNQMQTFINSEMALDLTPYLDEDQIWKKSFVDGILAAGTYNGKVYNLPEAIVYPLIIVNVDLLDKAGVEIKERWTWEEFIEACKKIKENTNAAPFGIQSKHNNWLVRCGLEQIWKDEDELNSFVKGEISFTDNRIEQMFDNIATLFKDNYCYGGDGAISLTLDEKNAAFATEEVAMIAEVNANVVNTLTNIDIKNIKIIGWPTMSEQDYINGGYQGYFIPANCKNPDLAVGFMKLLFSQQVMNYNADAGIVPTVKVESKNPYLEELSKDADRIGPAEILSLSPEISDYIQTQLPANYLLQGKECLEELDNLRKEAIQ